MPSSGTWQGIQGIFLMQFPGNIMFIDQSEDNIFCYHCRTLQFLIVPKLADSLAVTFSHNRKSLTPKPIRVDALAATVQDRHSIIITQKRKMHLVNMKLAFSASLTYLQIFIQPTAVLIIPAQESISSPPAVPSCE